MRPQGSRGITPVSNTSETQFDPHGHAGYPPSRMAESHLSPHAYERLQDELEERTTTRRRDLSLWIERAREHGDLKENADYHAAKNEHGLNEARIRQLEAMLKSAVIIESSRREAPSSPARWWSCVTTATTMSRRTSSDRSKNATRSTTCCRRTHRSDKRVLGKEPGATVSYQGPKRELSVTIVSVRPVD